MKCLILFCFLFYASDISAQTNHYKIKDNKRSEKVNFELFTNLIIIPLKINGVKLNFLLDSGVDKTILFSFEEVDSLMLKNTKFIKVRGLSSDEKYSAYKSTGNQIDIKNISNKNADIYVVFDQENYLTGSIGTVINGVIGYDLLKDFVLRFNYSSRNIKFYTPSKFNRPLIFYKETDIDLINNKPHLKASVTDKDIGNEKGIFLLDTGSSDAIWLYQNDSLTLPNKKFKDNIGFGFRGIITGYRSKIDHFNLSGYNFKNANVAFPDLSDALTKERIGSIGNEILKRFKFFISYPDRKLYLNSNYLIDENFSYDKSGLLIRYDGLSIIEKQVPVRVNIQTTSNDNYGSINKKESFRTIYEIKKKIKVAGVRRHSPAQKAGIQPKDIIVRLQGKSINQYDLKEVRKLLSSKNGKLIEMKITRNGKIKAIQFNLDNRLD